MATDNGVGAHRADSCPPMRLPLRWPQWSALDADAKSERGWSFDACCHDDVLAVAADITNSWDFAAISVLPLGVAVVLGLISARPFQPAPGRQDWSMLAVVASDLVMLLAARLVRRPPFFQVVQVRRENRVPCH